MELNLGIQSIPELETKACQTNWFRPQNFSVQYEPLEISEEERRRLLDTDEVIDFVKFVADRKVLQQNSIVNVFSDDFKELGDDDVGFEKGSHSVLQEYQSFTDLQHSKDKSVSCCDWHPTQKGIIAVSCTKRCTFEERIEQGFVVRSKQSLILIWSFNDPIHPQLILEGPEDIGCFQFNPSDPNFIAGGCINGQIVLWDISEHQDKLKSTRKRSSEDENGGNTGSSAGVDDEKLSSTIGGNDEPIVPVVKYIVASSIEFSHRSGISDLQWLPSSSLLSHSGELTENTDSGNRQLVTCSLDGQVYFWDTRSKKDLRALDLAWKPFLRVPLSAMDNTFDYGLTKVSLKSMNFIDARKEKPKSGDKSEEKRDAKKDAASVVPISKFFASSEEGEILFSDWVAEKSSEDKGSRVEYASNLHFGSISDLQRSPFFPDILLSVGGWSFHIWKEKLFGGPLLSSPTNNSYVISGRWSPTRPGVVFLSKSDGTIEVWDILDCTFQPNTVQNVASVGLSNMCVRQYPGKGGAQFVAAADDEGTLHILEVPRHLTKPLKNEKLLMQALFDREVKRIGYVSERKQIRNREKGAWEQSKQEAVLAAKAQAAALEAAAAEAAKKVDPDKAAPAAESAGENGEAPPEEVVDKEELEYLKFEKNFLISEGLLKEDSE
ncbi:WD repeat-containing protein 63 [Entophlyctis luteolus]|nr:WD repeat-containing protein 63 [Entophlyctis luteolus]